MKDNLMKSFKYKLQIVCDELDYLKPFFLISGS